MHYDDDDGVLALRTNSPAIPQHKCTMLAGWVAMRSRWDAESLDNHVQVWDGSTFPEHSTKGATTHINDSSDHLMPVTNRV